LTCFDEKIKRKLKLRNFKKVFQINKIVEFEISQLVGSFIAQNKKSPQVKKVESSRPMLKVQQSWLGWRSSWAELAQTEGQAKLTQAKGRAESTLVEGRNEMALDQVDSGRRSSWVDLETRWIWTELI